MPEVQPLNRSFPVSLIQSVGAQFAVARYVHSHGAREVTISALLIRPTFEERDEYSDEGDLFVVNVLTRRRSVIEVKGRSFDFTDAADFPYPTIYVSQAARVDERGPANAYFSVSRTMTHAAIVKGSTRAAWLGPTTVALKARDCDTQVYECPLTWAQFISLDPDHD